MEITNLLHSKQIWLNRTHLPSVFPALFFLPTCIVIFVVSSLDSENHDVTRTDTSHWLMYYEYLIRCERPEIIDEWSQNADFYTLFLEFLRGTDTLGPYLMSAAARADVLIVPGQKHCKSEFEISEQFI